MGRTFQEGVMAKDVMLFFAAGWEWMEAVIRQSNTVEKPFRVIHAGTHDPQQHERRTRSPGRIDCTGRYHHEMA